MLFRSHLGPPRNPPNRGFGGWDEDNFGSSNPYMFFFSLLCLLLGYILYNYGLKNYEKGLADLQKKLDCQKSRKKTQANLLHVFAGLGFDDGPVCYSRGFC